MNKSTLFKKYFDIAISTLPMRFFIENTLFTGVGPVKNFRVQTGTLSSVCLAGQKLQIE
jgi:hypothetical protein